MEITGTVKTIVSSKRGDWDVNIVVIDYKEDYNSPKESMKIIAIDAIGNNLEKTNGITAGDVVNVKFNATSREHNGKWYNSNNLWFINVINNGNSQPQLQSHPAIQQSTTPQTGSGFQPPQSAISTQPYNSNTPF